MPYYVLGAVALAAVLLVVFIATRPSTFRTERSATMAAPPTAPFALVNDFHNWAAWSPWAKMDPDMKLTFDGPPAGVGAVQRWEGNSKVGSGASTITESRPGELVRIRLEFLKPFRATNEGEFTFAPHADGTRVTWAMSGRKNFLFKAFCLLMDMDKMVGNDFEKGLAAMKAIVEAKG